MASSWLLSVSCTEGCKGERTADVMDSNDPYLGLRLRKISTTEKATTLPAGELEEEPVTPAGRVFMQPDLNCYIICTLGFQDPINVVAFKRTLSETLVNHKRFHSVLKKNRRGRDIWVQVEVNIDDHVSEINEFTESEKTAPQFIQNYVSDVEHASPLDSSRPLWHCYIINGTSGIAASYMVIRVHHAFGDGTSLMSLLLACTRRLDSPGQLPSIPAASKKRKEKVPLFRWFFSCILLVWNTVVGVLLFLSTILWFRDSDSIIKGYDGVENAKKKIVYSVIDINDMRVVKDAVNGTVNDVLMGMVAAGLHKYVEGRYRQSIDSNPDAQGRLESEIRTHMKHMDANSPTKKTPPQVSTLRIRACALVNTRGSPGLQELASMLKGGSQMRWGNNVGYVLFPIPLNHHHEPLGYVRAAKKISDKKKASLEAYFTYWAASLLMYITGAKLPAMLTRRVILQTTLAISNMPGPTEPITFSGNPIVQMFPAVTRIPQGVSVFLQSYMGKASLVVMSAEDIVPDPEVLCEYCVASLQEMLESAVAKRSESSNASSKRP
ncbi:hypothetical protein KC19_3G159800 [Ceratodon purpureus]|uniref:Diacylglycerol O-acyltransferase n=1 Tax=Ceratodon purpureus TaxID=3225 RepID=A0A8T0IL36_CERPU|nr:hypothetical protein KC19_3G159800 [Ceratodon purpureus]